MGKLRINNNALFVFAIVLVLLNSYTFLMVSKDLITGKAGAVGTTRICIGIPPGVSNVYPTAGVTVNGTINLSANANNTDFLDFYYFYFGIPEQFIATDNDSDNDTIYNTTLDTTVLPDGNCNYVILVKGYGVCGIVTIESSAVFTVNNIDVPPIWDKFKNNLSTNFSAYTSWVKIPSAQIGEPNQGIIKFTTENFDGTNLDYLFNISHNSIVMNLTQIYSCFQDVTYLLKFLNVTEFANPVILKNGVPCSAFCYDLEYNFTDSSYSFSTRAAGNIEYSIGEGGNLTINFTSLNKTWDYTPTINVTTYILGFVRNITTNAICYYMTDYNPTSYTLMENTGSINHSQVLPWQKWEYIPTNMGHYPYIQHHSYYSGLHNISVFCDIGYKNATQQQIVLFTYTDRDRVYYEDGENVRLYLRLEESGLNVTVNFSQIDSNFNPANVEVVNTGLDYNISYNISSSNTRPDNQYNLTIRAVNSTGYETMNGSIFIYLHNNWRRSDIDDAFDCWNFKQGYYFDEVACDWESDLNHVADLVDVFTTEISCFDTIDNDFDGAIDENDTDCAGVYYSIRRYNGIDSAFLGDPCFNNVCRVCLGDGDANDDGICDSTAGVNVRYLNKVRPGANFKAKFLKSNINNLSTRISINYINDTFDVKDATSSVEQLPRKELGGCIAGGNCKSVTGTTFGPSLPDRFSGTLNARINFTISAASAVGPHAEMVAGKSIAGSSAFQNLVFFEVQPGAIVVESDNASYCFDGEDNDLNDYYDCFDPSCNLTSNPSNGDRCEVPHELTCNDGFDNDRDGYTDCQDNDCFRNSPDCPNVENINFITCADSINNDFDYGFRCDAATSVSYQTRQTNSSYSGSTSILDCLDIDCNNSIGNILLNAKCEYCTEKTCNDRFDNDGDVYYDCTGNAYQNRYERDCDRWHDVILSCNTTETICNDSIDNDLDSDSLNGTFSWLGVPVYGGWDCLDLDCNGFVGNSQGAICQWRDETNCTDSFDNDADSLVDCYDPTSCKGTGGASSNLTGQCRPCAAIENISIDACRDSDDNDYNSDIDCADPDCYGKPGPGTIKCGLIETNCSDGIDNDYDLKIDQNDSDCYTTTYSTNEFGPGQCDDSTDNDNDGNTDCLDPDCATNVRCRTGSYTSYCKPLGQVGAINVCLTNWANADRNISAIYTRSTLGVASVVLKLGNVEYSLRNVSPLLDSTTSFMTGTTTNFVKVNDTYGLKAQNDNGFSGSLNLMLTSTTGNVTPGTYTLFVSTSIPGVYGTSTGNTYIAENEPPVVNNITIQIGNTMTGPGTVGVVFQADATDNGTYNSGIALCTLKLEGYFTVNSTDCRYAANLTGGSYNISAIAYDGAMNPSSLFWRNFSFIANTTATQTGGFYNPYPAENYPDRHFFNNSEMLNIGVNFEGGSGFTDNETGCMVEIKNSTDTVLTGYVNLSVVAGEAHCNGQINISSLFTSTNASRSPSAVYYFTVSVYDSDDLKSTSDIQDFNFCYYYYDNSSSKYRCNDQCQLHGLTNNPPVLISDIPNMTWPRGTKLSVIDLDDYFMDPDNDYLTYTWYIDTTRINVTIDINNIITFAPDFSFYGEAHITFYANDPFTATPSNIVLLNITFTPILPSQPLPAGGGGGGGANKNMSKPEELCLENWTCTDWGPCLPSGYQTRTCIDRNQCGTNNDMPDIMRECVYTPTCRDRLKNQGETGVDCGGPCPPCPSCKDGILNQKEEKISQIMSADPNDISDCGGPLCPACPRCDDNRQNSGETGIDCGGLCRSCATCNDGIRNQGEVNIDCGGPCQACIVKVKETAFNWNLVILVISSIFLLLLLLLALLFGVFKKKFIRLKAKLLNYHMRLMRMFEKKRMVEKELPILQWVNIHLGSISEELPTKGVDSTINEIDKLVRIFFKRIFLIRYAFTNDELVKELEKHRIPLVLRKAADLLLEELAQVKYGGESIQEAEAQTLINQFRVISERLVNEIETKKKAKINISEHDIDKIEETLSGANKLGVEEAIKKASKK